MNPKTIKKELARCAGELASEDLVSGGAGNISARAGKQIYIKKAAIRFKQAEPKDFVNIKNRKQVSAEWRLHLYCYKARPDIKTVVHTHPVAVLSLASMGMKIKPVTVDFAVYFKNGIKYTKFALPGSKNLAELTAKAIKNYDGVILSNHGLVTVGTSLKEATLRSIIAEREAKIILAAKLLNRRIRNLTKSQLKSIYKL
ncbi:MAG: class II aldolase/adducin family protein [Candidatus Omnitrophota bacterium]|nr:MAG: class II aldolase/adducin family protein [Candidatus Omnitrophota bacterium]